MRVSHDLDSLFLGSGLGGTLYRARRAEGRRTWVRFDVRPDGTLENETVVFDRPGLSWRGLPDA